jgi:hypothetical protein
MTLKSQQIAIAEACGWLQKTEYNSLAGWHKMTNTIVDEFFCKYTYDKDTKQCIGYVWKATSELPKYLTDLNAMHEAEKVLTDQQWDAYCFRFDSVGGAKFCAHATAAQRAEAFLRTIGKWEDAK